MLSNVDGVWVLMVFQLHVHLHSIIDSVPHFKRTRRIYPQIADGVWPFLAQNVVGNGSNLVLFSWQIGEYKYREAIQRF